ncbi:MAG TPA: DNA-directed RNA polymerase subunit L [Candidatus Nanoarchaeia archaeon]|nr:DNA-directed RNA polymerase subunit L [Candidatus Nanoarchaeia archaeon]
MEVKLIKKKENQAIVEVKGADHTIVNAIRRELWQDEKVDAAGYTIEHSLISQPRLIVNAKNPKKALMDAAERLHKQNKEMETLFKKLKA